MEFEKLDEGNGRMSEGREEGKSFPPPVGVWRWGRKSKGEKRETKKIGGKCNFWPYQIIDTD